MHANDFLRFAFCIARATVENNGTVLTEMDTTALLRASSKARTFIRDTFGNVYFNDEDNEFLRSVG